MIALNNLNQAWTWGLGTSGRLGDNTTTQKSSPVLVVGNHSFIQLVASTNQTNVSYGLKSNGEVWTWGNGSGGALGDNSTTSKSSPVLVVGGHSFTWIASGSASSFSGFALALKSNGSCWAWGGSNGGNLGNNDDSDYSSPVAVVGNHSFIKVCAGNSHALALKADGTAWTWGANSGGLPGVLGDNTNTPKSSPVSVVGNHSFIKIGCTGRNGSAFGLKANGQVWGWGGSFGDLGDGTFIGKSSPVLVIGSHSFIDISSGGATHTLALKADGSCWGWGDGAAGAIGDNTTSFRSSPVSVVGNHSFIQIYAITSGTQGASYGLKENGELWAWGRGANGHLGDNTLTSKSSPVLVVGNINFKAIWPNYFVGNVPEEQTDSLVLTDSILLESPAIQETDDLVLEDSIQVTSGESDAHFGTRILSINPLLFVTDNTPAEIVRVDTTDPENLGWTLATIIGVNNAIDASIDENSEFIYVTGADGLFVKIDINDLSNQTIIDTEDTDDLIYSESYDGQAIRYASTENTVGELYLIDERETFLIDSNFTALSTKLETLDSSFNCLEGILIDTDIQVLQTVKFLMNSDFKCLTAVLEDIEPIKMTDFEVYLDNVLLANTDVDLSSIAISHVIDEKSTATLILNRRHDKLNYDLENNLRTITNQNTIRIEIQGIVEFEGKISNINGQFTTTENVTITAKSSTPSYSYEQKLLSLPSLDKSLSLYDILVQNPQIENEYIDPDEANPKKYKGIRVPFGKKIKQSVTRYEQIDSLENFANKIQTNTFYPRQNWTYFWSPTVFQPKFFGINVGGNTLGTNIPSKPDNTPFHALSLPVFTIPEFQFPGTQATGSTSLIHFDYIGTSLSPVSSDIWVLKHANHRYQRVYDDIITRVGDGKVFVGEIEELNLNVDADDIYNALISAGYIDGSGNLQNSFKNNIFTAEDMDIDYSINIKNKVYDLLDASFGYYIGTAPYKTIDTRNGIFIPKFRWEDRANGLYSVLDAGYDFTTFAQKIAELEYQKLLNINGDIAPATSCTFELTLDAYYYFNLQLLNRINVDNTIQTNIYNNTNGFPVSIKTITITSNSRTINITADNSKSNLELAEIDGQYPDENDEEYNQPAQAVLIALKTDMATRLKVE